MKVKQKIIETRAGFRCRVCGRRFGTEEAAFCERKGLTSRGMIEISQIPTAQSPAIWGETKNAES